MPKKGRGGDNPPSSFQIPEQFEPVVEEEKWVRKKPKPAKKPSSLASSAETAPSPAPPAEASGAGAGAGAGAATVDGIDALLMKFSSRFPDVGMPTDWNKSTMRAHANIAYDPGKESGKKNSSGNPILVNPRSFKVNDEKPKWKSAAKIAFIKATAGKNVIHDTTRPDAVRVARWNESLFAWAAVKDARGEYKAMCPAHGEYVDAKAFQSDHAQAQEDIIWRGKQMVQEIDAYIKASPADMARLPRDYFVQVDGQVYGTRLFYETLFNDIDNIWLICSACNHHKSNIDAEVWFRSQPLYGQPFLDSVGPISADGLVLKTNDGRGLGQAALDWYWDKHRVYAEHEKVLFQEIMLPMHTKNELLDARRIVGDEVFVARGAVNYRFREAVAVFAASGPLSVAIGSEATKPEHVKGSDGKAIRFASLETAQAATAAVVTEFPERAASALMREHLRGRELPTEKQTMLYMHDQLAVLQQQLLAMVGSKSAVDPDAVANAVEAMSVLSAQIAAVQPVAATGDALSPVFDAAGAGAGAGAGTALDVFADGGCRFEIRGGAPHAGGDHAHGRPQLAGETVPGKGSGKDIEPPVSPS